MSDKEEPLILRTQDARGVVTLTLNRPQAFNALSEAMLADLQREFDAIASEESVRVVIIAAEGKAFCAGHDLKEMRADPSMEYYERLFAQCSEMMLAIQQLPVPVIARVQGIATAAGCQLVAMCDLAVASSTARFAVSGVNVGLFCSTPGVALSRNVLRKQAFEIRSRESCCDRTPPDLSLDRFQRLATGQKQFVVLLKIHPEVGGRAEVPRQTQCCIGGNPATLIDDLTDAGDRHMQFQSEAVDRNSQRLHELLAEHFAWVNRRTGDIPAAFRTHDAHIFAPLHLVIIDNFHIVDPITLPSETDSPLIADANAMQPGPITPKSLQPVPRRYTQFIERGDRIDLDQFPHRYAGDRVPPATHAGLEESLGLPFRETFNQAPFIV
jgi:hypothetical protein